MLALLRDSQGFSLIELLVGIVIIAILASVGAPSLMTWIQNSQLRTASETILNGLQLARAEAVQRNTNVLFSLNGVSNIDSSWTVCLPDPLNPGTCSATTIQSRNGTEGTTYANINADVQTVGFNGLGRATNAMKIHVTPPVGGSTCQALGGPMRCLDIVVASPGGQILMCNPAFHRSSNPQGC